MTLQAATDHVIRRAHKEAPWRLRSLLDRHNINRCPVCSETVACLRARIDDARHGRNAGTPIFQTYLPWPSALAVQGLQIPQTTPQNFRETL